MREPVKGITEAGRRREQRARATRGRIVDAARKQFLASGYAGTTVETIAKTAGVATATVYQAFGTKSAILARALDEAIVDDDEPIAMLERAWVADARRHRDPRRRLTIVVEHTAGVAVRTAPLKVVMRDAAATEPEIGELIALDDARRLATQKVLVEVVLGREPSPAELAGFYLLVNSSAWTLATEQLGWSPEEWTHWLVEGLGRLLLEPDRG